MLASALAGDAATAVRNSLLLRRRGGGDGVEQNLDRFERRESASDRDDCRGGSAGGLNFGKREDRLQADLRFAIVQDAATQQRMRANRLVGGRSCTALRRTPADGCFERRRSVRRFGVECAEAGKRAEGMNGGGVQADGIDRLIFGHLDQRRNDIFVAALDQQPLGERAAAACCRF